VRPHELKLIYEQNYSWTPPRLSEVTLSKDFYYSLQGIQLMRQGLDDASDSKLLPLGHSEAFTSQPLHQQGMNNWRLILTRL